MGQAQIYCPNSFNLEKVSVQLTLFKYLSYAASDVR